MRRRSGESGQAMVIIAIAMVSLMGMAALSIDVGHYYAATRTMQDVSQAAALAGAMALPDQQAALQNAQDYLGKNGVPLSDATIQVTASTVRVEAFSTVHFWFAPVIGFSSARADGWTVAGLESPSGSNDTRPWGVPADAVVPGQDVTLKAGAGGGSGGNFGAVQLCGSGASSYENNIVQGCSQPVTVGQALSVQPGAMAGPTDSGVQQLVGEDPNATWQTVQPGSPRLVIVPVVSPPSGHGENATVTVQGFAMFFVEGPGSANGSVVGRFMQSVDSSHTYGQGGADFGLQSIQVVQQSY